MVLIRRRFAYSVSGSVSVFGWRSAVGVGGSREHVRLAWLCGRRRVPLHSVYPLHSLMLSASRAPHTNTLTHSPTRPAGLYTPRLMQDLNLFSHA
jgi:hypothetical protein